MSDDPMLEANRRTYHRFVRLVAYSTLAVIIVLALMATFLV